jgi:hypothetical protein
MATPIAEMYSSSAQHSGDYNQQNNANFSRPGAYGSADPSPTGSNDDLEPSSADPLRAQFSSGGGDAHRPESYMDSDLEMRKYQGLSASGVAGYSAVGDISEPGSPVQEGSYERSHESGSSGTKVDQGSSRLPRPETMSSEGSYDARHNQNVRFLLPLFLSPSSSKLTLSSFSLFSPFTYIVRVRSRSLQRRLPGQQRSLPPRIAQFQLRSLP